MAYSLEKLLAELGLEKLPTRWVEFFPALMDDFDKNGCPLLDGKYYDRLNQEYGMLDGLVDIPRRGRVGEEKRAARKTFTRAGSCRKGQNTILFRAA